MMQNFIQFLISLSAYVSHVTDHLQCHFGLSLACVHRKSQKKEMLEQYYSHFHTLGRLHSLLERKTVIAMVSGSVDSITPLS